MVARRRTPAGQTLHETYRAAFSPSKSLSQNVLPERCTDVDLAHEAQLEANSADRSLDLSLLFQSRYGRIARLIARLIRDPARAEELAVEVFLRWSKQDQSSDKVEGWLYRTALRLSLDELRRKRRRSQFENLVPLLRRTSTPEEVFATNEEAARVRLVLTALNRRSAEVLLLRSEGLSYLQIASTLALNPSSIGTLLCRAQQAFRKEYIKRYGNLE